MTVHHVDACAPMPRAWPEVLAQWDDRWGNDRTGGNVGKRSGGKNRAIGCLATAWAQILRDDGVDAEATPTSIALATKDLTPPAWAGALMVQPVLARHFGYDAEEIIRGETQGSKLMRDMLALALQEGHTAILHVDHDASAPGGDEEADHFVKARRIDGDAVIYADPATGDEGPLKLRTLTGTTRWSERVKVYQVRSLRIVRRV